MDGWVKKRHARGAFPATGEVTKNVMEQYKQNNYIICKVAENPQGKRISNQPSTGLRQTIHGDGFGAWKKLCNRMHVCKASYWLEG